MQTFKINRNSWHYAMNCSFFNEYSDCMELWERRHSNFCAYWRSTIFRIIAILFMTASLLVALMFLGYMAYLEPLAAAYAFSTVVLVVAAVVGTALLQVRYAKHDEEPKTLIGKKYAAYKSKVCPLVEFDQ
jgi:small-conductance mechanosensitive channel